MQVDRARWRRMHAKWLSNDSISENAADTASTTQDHRR